MEATNGNAQPLPSNACNGEGKPEAEDNHCQGAEQERGGGPQAAQTCTRRCTAVACYLAEPLIGWLALVLCVVVPTLPTLPFTLSSFWEKPVDCHQNCHTLTSEVDKFTDDFVRMFGNAIPLVLLICRCALIGGEGWRATVVFWVLISATRFLGLFVIRATVGNRVFSDHVFLVTSIFGMVFTELRPAGKALEDTKRPWRWVLLVAIAWVLLLSMLLEVWVTAWYYHTRQASLTALLAGIVIFGWIFPGMWDQWGPKNGAAKARERGGAEGEREADPGYRALSP